jgi:DNA repair protein RecO (recombination protein O)
LSGERLKLLGVVLRTIDYGEADRVVALLTRERGKVSAFARGARASRRRFGGALEPFTLLRLEARERRGSDLLALDSAAVERGFAAIRGDLARIACASYACDLARELVRDAEPHPDLYGLLVEYLGRLELSAPRPAGLRAFELGALSVAGFRPCLDACVRCGGPPAPRARVLFHPDAGGVLCGRCGAGLGGEAPQLGPDALAWLVQLQRGGLASAAEAPPGRAGAEAREALSRFLEHHLGHRLASRRFLDEVGPMLGG